MKATAQMNHTTAQAFGQMVADMKHAGAEFAETFDVLDEPGVIASKTHIAAEKELALLMCNYNFDTDETSKDVTIIERSAANYARTMFAASVYSRLAWRPVSIARR